MRKKTKYAKIYIRFLTIAGNLFIGPPLQITLETAIRVRPDVPENWPFDITVQVKPVIPTPGVWDSNHHLGQVQERLEAATPTAGDIPTTAVAAADVALVAGVNNTAPVPISTAQKKWLPFTITVPKYTVAHVTVSMTFASNLNEKLREVCELCCLVRTKARNTLMFADDRPYAT